MADIARFLRFDGQPPLIRLIFSFCTIVITGTLFFWIFILAGSLIFGLSPEKMLRMFPEARESVSVTILKYIQFSQQVGAFLIPSLIAARCIKMNGGSFLRIGSCPRLSGVLLVIVLAFLLIPILDFTGALNSRIEFPDWLSGVRQWMRSKEDTARHLTGLMIVSPGIPTFIVNIFILAVIPALGEEFLFRGIFQQILSDLFRSANAGIWVTAVLFSSIHLQFFGFVPRLILGLVFGYLFYWSGNLWFPVIAHFLNNLIPVTAVFLGGWWEAGITKDSVTRPALILAALVLSAFVLFYFWRGFNIKDASPGDLSSDSD